MHLRSIALVLSALVVGTSALYLSKRPRPRADFSEQEQAVVLPSPPEVASPSPVAVPAPAPSELQPTLDRAFGRTLTVDPQTAPAFAAGDFNGDGAADLAVAVRPLNAGALARLNADLTRWSVQDAAGDAVPATRPEPARVAAGDRLLAVIHGVHARGWRDPGAVELYLVKNAVGSGMKPRPLSSAPPEVRLKAFRAHSGDVIAESRGGEPGVILWTGAAYVWAAGVTGAP